MFSRSSYILMILLLLEAIQFHAQEQVTNFGNFRTYNSSSITVFGNLYNNGTIIDSAEVITLGGSVTQNMGGTSVTTIKNLTLNNPAGASLAAAIKISRELNIVAGTFSSTGFDVTLLSDINGTARIAPILGDFAGNITMQRYLPSGNTGWRFLASPVTGATIADLQDDFVTTGFTGATYPVYTFTSVYTYDESALGPFANGYLPAANATDPLTPGKGYWCYIGPVPLTVDLTGPPVKFGQSFNVGFTASGGTSEDGWVMIGNPYPSPIDWSSASWTKSNVNGAIYIWNPALQQYASWVGGISTNGGSNIIASSQSFWVQTNGASPSLTCTENIKVAGNPTFLKPVSQNTFATIRLNLAGNGFTDETYIRFGPATNNYDHEHDARKVVSDNPLVPSISSLDSTLTDMSVNSLPTVSNNIHVPVRVRVGASGVYTLNVDSISGIPPNTCVVLEDLLTGNTLPLSPSGYTFNISDTTVAARFVLHVKSAGSIKAQPVSCFGKGDGKAIGSATGTGPWNYVWKDSSGVVLKNIVHFNTSDTLTGLLAGNYFLEITGSENYCFAQNFSIIIFEPARVIAGFLIQNNKFNMDVNDTIYLSNISTGAFNHTWDFGDGTNFQYSQQPVSHIYNYPGTYLIKLLSYNNTGCSDSVTQVVDVNSVLVSDISANHVKGIKIYPNPTAGILQIMNANVLLNPLIDIFTVHGVKVLSSVISAGTPCIDLSAFAKGVYFYSIQSENLGAIKGKFILE